MAGPGIIPPQKFLTAAGLVKTGKGFVTRIMVYVGTIVDTVTIYDNTAASGTVIWKCKYQKEAGVPIAVHTEVGHSFTTGCYVSFAGGLNQITDVGVTFE